MGTTVCLAWGVDPPSPGQILAVEGRHLMVTKDNTVTQVILTKNRSPGLLVKHTPISSI